MIRRYIPFLLLALLFLSPVLHVMAQETGGVDLTAEELADLGEAATPIKEMRPQKNKVVFLIFDVSGSMKGFKMWNRAREAASNILRYGCSVGDEVGLVTFGADSQSTIRKIESGDDRAAILEKIPKQVSDGSGTNIRQPHHQVLKELEKREGRPAYIIVFTDSYNDEPKATDPNYVEYKKYYTPGGMLKKYPKTPENRDYERLLQDLVVDGKVKQYGIGINFSEDGRPIERLPQSAPPPVEVTATPEPTTPVSKPEEKTSPILWIVLGIIGMAAAGGLVAFVLMPKPVALRIVNGPKDSKDFQVRSNQPVRIGGEGAKFAPDAFPIAELKTAIAIIRPGRGGLTIAPFVSAPVSGKNAAATSTPAATPTGTPTAIPTATAGNESPKVRVLLNGMPLEAEMPVGYGDELRIAITPVTGSTVAKEYRLKLDDPKRF